MLTFWQDTVHPGGDIGFFVCLSACVYLSVYKRHFMFISIVMCLFLAAADLPLYFSQSPGTEPPFSHWPLVFTLVVLTVAAFSRNVTPAIFEGLLYNIIFLFLLFHNYISTMKYATLIVCLNCMIGSLCIN